MKDNTLNVIDENGKTKIVNVLKYFKLKSTNKEYIIYSNVESNNGIKEIYASEIIENNEYINLNPISDEDKIIINRIIKGGIENG